MQTTAARIHAYGGPGVLSIDTVEVPPPAPGEVQIRQSAIGVNFVDVYHRTGLYPLPTLPSTLGVEGAGTIIAVGPGVRELHLGQRVVYAGPPVGGYCGVRNFPAERVLPLVDEISDQMAAGAMLRGITAHMLFSHVRPLRPGETVLIHAAAGGLGLVLVQWAKSLGARVIGTVGSAAKADLALTHGLDEAILHREEDFVARTLAFTQGAGADYVIDGIGGETLRSSLAATRPFGMVASIGQVAGEIGPIEPALLGPARSVALSRPGVFGFMRDVWNYQEGARATLSRLASGLRVCIGDVLPLQDAAEAHRRLEAGTTMGSLLLQP